MPMNDARLSQIKERYNFVAARPYMVGTDHEEIGELLAEVEWLRGLFDFSDPEIVLHCAPNNPLTADAVIVRRSHYEAKK